MLREIMKHNSNLSLEHRHTHMHCIHTHTCTCTAYTCTTTQAITTTTMAARTALQLPRLGLLRHGSRSASGMQRFRNMHHRVDVDQTRLIFIDTLRIYATRYFCACIKHPRYLILRVHIDKSNEHSCMY